MNKAIRANIVSINGSEITIKNEKTDIKIRFEECAKNYADENSLKNSKCVATRDITKLTFTFYTSPKIDVVFKRRFFKDLFSGKSAVRKFLNLQKAINQCGYTSYDLS